MVIPFGSYTALQRHIVDGTIVKTVSQGRFIVGERDDNGYISWQIANLKQHEATSPAVCILGGSATRECIVSQSSLSSAIAERWGRRPLVKMLASSVQDYPRALAIVDNLQLVEGSIIVIAVHHCPFASPRTSATNELKGIDLLMQSPALRDLVARRLGGSPSNSLREGLKVYLGDYRGVRGVDPFRGRSVAYLMHRYSKTHIVSNAAKRRRVDYWLNGKKGKPGGAFDTYFAFNAACLTETVKLARSKGLQVLLMECPQNAFIVGTAFDRYKTTYRPLCQKLVDEQGAHYVDINVSAGLVNMDFRDVYHLVEPGRDKWQAKLADALAQIAADHIPTEPPASPSAAPNLDDASSMSAGHGGLHG